MIGVINGTGVVIHTNLGRAPLPAAWIDKKRDLQVKILARMRGLGMKPILPAFAGYVPKAFALKAPKAKIYKMRSGAGFHFHCCYRCWRSRSPCASAGARCSWAWSPGRRARCRAS